jgi:hypothetical protein
VYPTGMSRLTVIKTLICFAAFINIHQMAHADETYLYKNIVKITVDKPDNMDENGFGIIVYEKDDLLYIATAKHVVEAGHEFPVRIKFITGKEKTATIVHKHDKLDLALLEVERPDNYVWEFRDMTGRPKDNDKIKIIGRYGYWSASADVITGTITGISGESFTAKFYGASIGASGGPVISGNKITGMITVDEGSQIEGIPIDVVLKQTKEWLGVSSVPINDLPAVSYGISLGGTVENIVDNKNSPLLKRSTAYPYFNPGVYFQVIVQKHVSLQYEINYRSLKRQTNGEYGPYHQFKNHYVSHSFTLHINFLSYNHEFLRYENELPVPSELILGYSINKMKPELNIEETGWTALRDQSNFTGHYSDRFSSVCLGIGFPRSLYIISMKMDILFEYYFTHYLFLDVVNPFDERNRNDWSISVNLKLGLFHRPKSSRISFVR